MKMKIESQNKSKPEKGWSVWVENGEWFTAPEVDSTIFGGHDYDNGGYDKGIRDCICGCYMLNSSSAGPVDPFGACPMNPKRQTEKTRFPNINPAVETAVPESPQLPASGWYVQSIGQSFGPYHLEQMREFMKTGKITRDSLIWVEGLSEWVAAGNVEALFHGGSSVQSPDIGSNISCSHPLPRRLRSIKKNSIECHSYPKPLPERIPVAKRIALLVGAVFSGIVAFFGILTTIATLIALVMNGLDNWKADVIIPMLVVPGLTIGAIWLYLKTNRKLYPILDQYEQSQYCQHCGRKSPTIKVGLNRHVGAIVLMFHKSTHGNFCRTCISNLFKEYTLITFFFGWWGIISFIVTPVVLINNLVVFFRSRSLPPTNATL